jgi:hypothetical protein
MNIFVSYTLRDGWLDVKQLKTIELALAGFGNPYIDIIHNRSYHRQSFVVRMLHSAELLVACWTRDFFVSPWVRFELYAARQRQIPIIVLDYGILNQLILLARTPNKSLQQTAALLSVSASFRSLGRRC